MLKRSSLFRSRYTTGVGIMVLTGSMLVLACISFIWSWNYYKSERSKELLHWQVVLGLVADSRSKDLNEWAKEEFKTLSSLSNNVSLKLYMAELEDNSSDNAEPEYLKVLLQVTSERSDFRPQIEPAKMPNNTEIGKTGGIALLDMKMSQIASTQYMPPITGELENFIKSTPLGHKNFLDIFTQDGKTPLVAFLMPVFSVQGDGGEDDQIGYIIGVTEVGNNVFSRLYQPGLPYSNYETLLVRKAGNLVEYFSPLANGTKGFLKLDINTRDLDATYLFSHDGGFANKTDYRKKDVLAYGRKLEVLPWFLIHKIDTATALKDGNTRIRNTIALLSLTTLFVLAVLFSVWRHASSLRAETAAKEYKEIAERNNKQQNLLRLVTDSQPDSMFILDVEGIYRFSNLKAAIKAKMTQAQLIGKSIQAVIGRDWAMKYLEKSKEALSKMGIISYLSRDSDGVAEQVYLVKHIPMKEIPDPYSNEVRKGTLVIEHDITSEIAQKEKRERILRNLVETLTSLVDKRVPFSVNHSARVSKIASIIAQEMGLDKTTVETVEFAGKLMNLGKIFIAEGLLTREGPLSDQEIQQVRESMQASTDLIKNIEFDGPVMETIRQAQEKLDGTGLLGLKGDEIILPAKITSVANALISMTSPRAYRAGLNIDQAVKILMKEAGTKYERSVVVALANYIDNRPGDNNWLLNG